MPEREHATPRLIEEAALRAWPASQQLLYDGWIARLSDGYTKRANSALLLYPHADSDPTTVIPTLERLYRAQGLPVIFRLLSFTSPSGLDDAFQRRGYRIADETTVMALDLSADWEKDPAVEALSIEYGIDAHARMNHLSPTLLAGHRRILERIPGALSVFGLVENGDLVSCGLEVVDGELAGIFGIVTEAAHRRKGYGIRLVRSMLTHAVAMGAATAYLQVVDTNTPAITLYRSLGFQESYRYHYRVLD